MTNKWPLLLLPAVLLIGAACGDGSDKADNPQAAASSSAAAPSAPAGQPTTNQPLPSATPVPDDGTAVQVVSGKEQYAPTLADVRALPQTELTINGSKRSGVALKDLVAKVPAGAAGIVTIEGTNADRSRLGTVRFKLADIADTTLLVIDGEGHLDIVSSTIPEEQWLKSVSGVSLS